MKTLLFLLLLTASLVLGACVKNDMPDAATISSLPVIELGQQPPADNEYVLWLHAGESVPVTLTIAGSMLVRESVTNINVELIKDVYLYKQWSSLDGKNWHQKNVNFQVGAGLDPKGGQITITLDEIVR